MNTFSNLRRAGLTAIAASLAAAFGSAQAALGEDLSYYTRPDSSVRVGLGYLSDDAARFGMYSSMNDMGLYAIGEVRLVKRDDPTGTWIRLDGRSLGLDSRSLRFEHERQGSWRYILDYRKSPRHSPYTIHTGLTGIGSGNLTINGVPGRNVSIKTEREHVGLAGEKIVGNGIDVKVGFRQETKKGSRLFGRGTTGATGGQEFLAEPIDHEMRHVDVVVGYTGERLQLSGGYYGSFFRNDNTALRIAGGASGLQIFTPISLPPDNEAHQFHLAGGYSFTPGTRGTFKVARTVATQNDTFMALDPGQNNVSGRRNLGGRVVTTLAQAGVSARPSADLTLRANLKYEDRDDKTPIARYVPLGTTGAGFNHPRDFRQLKGNVDASYRLTPLLRLNGGIDHDKRTRNSQDVRSVSFRRNTEETSYRIELRRTLSETLNGSLAFVRSERDGSRFETTTLLDGTPGSNLVAPLHLADRDRDTVRVRADWTPTHSLSLQFLVDLSEEKYGGRELGPHKRRAQFWSVDASYAISEDWQGHAWVSRDYSRAINRQQTSAGQAWQASLRLVGDAVGFGVRGRLGEKWEVGGDLQYSTDRSSYGLNAAATTPPSAPPAEIPKVKYSLASLKLSAKYAMRRDLALRFDVVQERWSTNDWLWRGYRYTDGTTLYQDRTQNVSFVGVSVQYNWR